MNPKPRESQLVRGEPLPPRASNDPSLFLFPSLFALCYLIFQFVDEHVDEQRDLLFVRTQSISLKTGGRHVQGDQRPRRAPCTAASWRLRSRHRSCGSRTIGSSDTSILPLLSALSFRLLSSRTLRDALARRLDAGGAYAPLYH